MDQRRQGAAGLLPGLSRSIRACVPTAGRARHPPPTTKPSRGSSTRRARRSTPEAPTSPSPTSPARWASPGRRSTGTSPAPTHCWSPRPCTPPSDFLERLATTCGHHRPGRSGGRGHRDGTGVAAKDKHIGLLVVPGPAEPAHRVGDVGRRVGVRHSMVRRFDVDWAGLGFSDADLDELAEHLLRIIQSFVIDPGRPPRPGEDLRDYLRRWVGAAIQPSAAATSSARTRTTSRR